MKKRRLSLNKEVLTANHAVDDADGGLLATGNLICFVVSIIVDASLEYCDDISEAYGCSDGCSQTCGCPTGGCTAVCQSDQPGGPYC